MKDGLSGIVFLNGQYLDAKDAKVSAFDRGFIFGDGIYEVVPIINSKLVDSDEFWARFQRSMEQIELEFGYQRDEFENILYEVIKQNGVNEGGIYIQITRGVAPRSFEFIRGLEPTIFIFCYKTDVISNPFANTGIDVISVDDIRWKRRDIKSISLLAQCYAKNEAVRAGVFEAIMVENGFVTEGSSSSVFIIKDNKIITKPLSNEILPGIRRQNLLKFAKNLGLKIELREFGMQELYEADEAFISAATIILLPIVKADGRVISSGKVGRYCHKLREMYINKLLNVD